jgi:hypothetical protein
MVQLPITFRSYSQFRQSFRFEYTATSTLAFKLGFAPFQLNGVHEVEGCRKRLMQVRVVSILNATYASFLLDTQLI